MSDKKTRQVDSWIPPEQSDIEETVEGKEWKYCEFRILKNAFGDLVSEFVYPVSKEEFNERRENYFRTNPDSPGTPTGLAHDRKNFVVNDRILNRGLRKMIDKIDDFYKNNPHLNK